MRSRREKPPNEMSRKDWEEMMGMKMDTNKRARGLLGTTDSARMKKGFNQ